VLIDCHVHVNSYDETRPGRLDGVITDLFDTMAECEVAHAVVITSYKVTEHRPHVDEVIRRLGDDPRVSIVEGLRWRGPGERTDLFNMEERIQAGTVRGIKLYPGYDRYPINDPSLESFFLLAAKYKVPVMIHTGDTYSKHAKVRQAHPLLVDDVAVDFPDVNFVMCHLGNPWFLDAAEVLYKNDNVFADISGLTLGEFSAEFEKHMLQRVREMIHYMGDPSRQLMYGTDWPLVGMRSYGKFFRSLDLTDEERENIAWRNAARLFKIDIAAPQGAPAASGP
jgi:predicted TIM-barrel fold metal-dependent hydrolase